MRSLYFLLEKEFKQMFRSKGLLRTLFIAPVIQLILMPMAANYSVKNISLAVVDHDHTSVSLALINKVTASGHFQLVSFCATTDEALHQIELDKADLMIEIPAKFEQGLVRENAQKMSIQVNAIEGVKAGLAGGYLSSILSDFNAEIRTRWLQPSKFEQAPVISIIPINWYNQFLNYYLFIVPGILVNLITGIGIMQAAFNLVKEKEMGTIEQINVTPIKKQYFILGKLLPFYALSVVIFTVGLLIGFVFYNVYPVGSFFTMYTSLFAYLFALLGFGLLLSTYSETQQQTMSLAFFFLNVLNMMSGLFTSIDSMPQWAKIVTGCFPVSHFIQAMRMIMLKGSTLSDVSFHVWSMVGIGLVFNTWAVLNYRKRS
ncbi:inner membrane transport permease YbhR [Filimonas sp.]|nr:inner membrane transport permease YbhR [Filimonas sp.]